VSLNFRRLYSEAMQLHFSASRGWIDQRAIAPGATKLLPVEKLFLAIVVDKIVRRPQAYIGLMQ
jgi:hypothetical protein